MTEQAQATEVATETAATDVKSPEQTQTAVDQAQQDNVAPDKQDEQKTEIEYTDFTAPEGTQLDADLMTEFKAVAKECGLTQEQAQKLVDMGAQMQAKLIAQNQAAWDVQRSAWEESAKTDKEYGGEKFNENLAIAKQAYDAFATPELKQLLDTTGMGNHPEMIRAFYKAGLLLSEDKVVTADRGAATSGNDPRSLYPNSQLN